jgi:hypothetical protein
MNLASFIRQIRIKVLIQRKLGQNVKTDLSINKKCCFTSGKTFFVFTKYQPGNAKWRQNASKREGHLSVVSQLKQFDLIKLKLDLSGKASLGKRRGTVIENV